MNSGGKHFLSLFLCVCCLAFAGCRSSRPNPDPKAKQQGKAQNTAQNRQRNSVSGSAGSDKVAEAHAHFTMGVIHQINEEYDAALKEYYQAAMEDPSDEELSISISGKFVENKELDKAVEVLNRRASQPDATGKVFAQLGILYSQLGKTNEAMQANRMAIKKSPAELAGYESIVSAHLQNKQYADAMKALDDATAQPKATPEFLLGLAGLYLRVAAQAPGQKDAATEKARAVLDRTEKLHPEDTLQKLALAELLNATGSYQKAAQLYLDLLKKLPDDENRTREKIRARLTDIYLRGNDPKQAAEQLQEIIRDDPTNPLPYYWLGNIAFDRKQFQDAADAFNRCLLLSQNFEPAYYELAASQLNLNKPGDALSTLEKARQRFKPAFTMEFWTGTALARQKAYKEALRHYTQAEVLARATEPKRLNEVFYFEFGAAFERSGDYEQAEKYFQKSIEASPDFAEALNYLGYMWVEHGTKLTEAQGLIEKAVKIEPKNPAYLDSLGWVQFKLGQPKEGLVNLLKAAEFSPEPDATIFDHIGDVYAALKETDKAREAWQKSLSLEKNEAVQKKLESAQAK